MATNRHSLSCSPPPPLPEGLLDDVLSFYQTLPPAASLTSPTGVSTGGSRTSACSSLLPSSSPSPLPGNGRNAKVTPVNGAASVALVTHGDRTAAAAAAAQTAREHEGANLQITRSSAKPNQHHEKMKYEAEYLRSRVRELESELKALRQGNMTAFILATNNATLRTAWQCIAKSQLGLRMASEAENRSLKRELRLHLEMTNNLAQTLGKRLNSSSPLHAVAATRKRGHGSKDDVDFFRDFVDDLGVAFKRLNSVFKNNGLDKVATDMQCTIQTRTTSVAASVGAEAGATTQFVEMCDVAVTPFAAWATANASWESTAKQLAMRKYGEVERVWQAKDVVASVFCMQGQAPLKARVAVKKYFDDPHRLVLAWRGHSSCVGGFSEYIADETGWAVFEPLFKAWARELRELHTDVRAVCAAPTKLSGRSCGAQTRGGRQVYGRDHQLARGDHDGAV